jgi:hypothetical protein
MDEYKSFEFSPEQPQEEETQKSKGDAQGSQDANAGPKPNIKVHLCDVAGLRVHHFVLQEGREGVLDRGNVLDPPNPSRQIA